MLDRDILDMFLSFQLDRKTKSFAGIDLALVGLPEVSLTGVDRWVCWDRCFMGFGPSLYMAIRMELITQEIIWGNRYDPKNAFWWDHLKLNLPGSGKESYKFNRPWVPKHSKDGSMASDFCTSVDNKRCTGSSEERIWEAKHMLATQQGYLGIQGASRKVQCRSKAPGAWVGVEVRNNNSEGLVVLISQDKWKRMQAIIMKWL